MTDHRDTLVGIVSELTGRDRATLEGQLDLPLADVGLDSIRVQELIAELEDAYDVEIAPEDTVHLETLGAIERYLRGQG
ncbi:MAG: acyl carrier protein [Planctomycetota bacterium]